MTRTETQIEAGHAGARDDTASETRRDRSAGDAGVIHRSLIDRGVCVLCFDRPGSSANVFDRTALLELSAHLEAIAADDRVRGVLLVSAKDKIFVAGADIHALADEARTGGLRELIDLGQRTFNQLAQLKVPTVAAIHGACVGGGYEVCLACDYRVASPDSVTRIGLPETLLGILPAWGGSTRLPRLVGIPKALDVILRGRTLRARHALKLGMIDSVAPKERLNEVARQYIGQGKPRRRSPWHLNNFLVAGAIRRRLHSQLRRKFRGHYPAIPAALDVVTRGVTRTVQESLALEREAISRLVDSDSCRNLVRVFLTQERVKKHARSGEEAKPLSRVAVIGAGVMGAGIAQWVSSRGHPVLLRDIDAGKVDAGLKRINRLYREGVRRRLFTTIEAQGGLDRVYPSATEVPMRMVDLVIEAAVEKMEVKKAIFARLAKLSGPDTILATNTSALSISEVATAVDNPSRVVGLHFFNPVHRMKLVEVVVGRETSEEAVKRVMRFVLRIGKLPVRVADRPGFLVNRVLMPYLVEAGLLFEEGAPVEAVDEAMLDFGMPMGPLRLLDEVGVDVAVDVAATLSGHFGARLSVPDVLRRMQDEDLLGRKSGRGFYMHNAGKVVVNPRLSAFRRGTSATSLSREQLQARMVYPMINEATRCLEENVVATPEDVDFGMLMGTGFAPFRGGPLRHADAIGLDRVVTEMTRLAGEAGERFKPCGLLLQMARERGRFFPGKGLSK